MQDRFQRERADYDAAHTSRFQRVRSGIAWSGSHADYHYRNDSHYLKVLEKSRDLDRNNAVVGRMLTLSADATVQAGITTKSTTGFSGLDDAIDALFSEWGDDPTLCDAQGEMTFGQMQHLAFRQSQLDGDVIGLLTDEGTVQHFESHRCRKPSKTRRNVVLGVLLDGNRRRKQYWITKEDVDPSSPIKSVDEVQPYDVYDAEGLRRVVHLYGPKRFSQTRGVSALAPIFDLSGMAEDIHFAKLVQAQTLSCWGIFIERTGDYAGGLPPQLGERETENLADGSARLIENQGPGMIVYGNKGEKPNPINAQIPNPEYFPFIRLTHQMMMAALGLPYMLVMLDASDTNFSGWRGAYDIAKMGWRQNQRAIVSRYVKPIRRWKIAQWLENDPALKRLAARKTVDGVYRCSYHLPTYPYIQPAQDAMTDILMLANMLTSPQRLFASKGEDAYDVAAETIEFRHDQILAAAVKANEINAAAGLTGAAAVTWRDLLPMPSAQGLNVTLNATPEPQQSKKGEPVHA